MQAQPQIIDNYRFLAGRDIPRSAGAVVGALASPSLLARGEIVVTNASNEILDTATVLTTPEVKLVMGRGVDKSMVETMLFTPRDISNYRGQAFRAKVNQAQVFGFNPATTVGAIPAIANNEYRMTLNFVEMWGQEGTTQYVPFVVAHETGTTATQQEIARALFRKATRNISLYWSNPRPVAFRMYNSGTATASGLTGTALPFTNTIQLSGVYAGVVGDYVRIGGTALTDRVYKVLAIDVVNNILQVEGYIMEGFAGVAVDDIPEATANAGDFGIEVVGLSLPFALDSRQPFIVRFNVGLLNFGATPNVTTATPDLGFGTYELMRVKEAAFWVNQGQLFIRQEFPPIEPETDLVDTQNYSSLNISIKKGFGQLTSHFALSTIEIACALDGNVANTFDTNFTGVATSVVDVLDAYAVINPALVAQLGNL
jgi:hypothetical protein